MLGRSVVSKSIPQAVRENLKPDGFREKFQGMGSERREHERHPVKWPVDVRSENHFLYSIITNISEMGMFVSTHDPMPVGTKVTLSFDEADPPLSLEATVAWVNPVRDPGEPSDPGMGVRFRSVSPEQREQLVHIIRSIAYIDEELENG